MKTRKAKDINPLLFGVALTISFAGFLFSRIRIRPSLPPPPPSPPDVNKQVHRKGEIDDDDHTTPRTPSCREPTSSSEAHERPHLGVRIDNGSSSSSPSTRQSSGRDGFLLPEFNELIKEFDVAPISDIMSTSLKREIETSISGEGITPKGTNNVERDEYEQEIESLRSMVRDLREREKSLEVELLEYYGLKEQETTVMELINRLKISKVEAKVFSLKIESLQAENRRFQAKVADYTRVVDELEAAKAKIKELKKKLRSDAEQNKELIVKLKQKVLMLQLPEQNPDLPGSSESSDLDMLGKLQRLEDLENEVEQLRKSKDELQRENSELAHRLECSQILASSMFEDPEVEELNNEVIHLREENQSLTKEVERLQSDRCADAEELVYLRWVNACLRYELRNQQLQPGQTIASDLSKSLSPNSEAKAKQLILEYANINEEKDASIMDLDYDQWSSSQSHQTDSGEPNELWVDASLTNKAQHSKKLKFLDKLRRLVRGKDIDDHATMHNKASALVKSMSVDDIGKTYSSVAPRCNAILTPSQNSTKSSRALSLSPEDAKYMESVKGSLNSSRFSTELNRFSSVSAEDAKDMEIMKMNRSSSTSSSLSYKRFVLGRESAGSISPFDSHLDKDSELNVHKPDLVRYAEVLKDSPWTQKTHRKSASYSAS